MDILGIIAKKRDGLALTKQEIEFFIRGVTDGSVADYQASALLMAIRINGMSAPETAALTLAMMNSGKVADLSGIEGIKVDKHSTGGVGDTVTLVAAPLAAACGCKIAKMSGRGLGHTGGTIDKLNSIGMRTNLSVQEMIEQTRTLGICVAEQSAELAPADGILYALRDVTATVDSVPLIASSILSKKFATGAGAIVLDVKCGSGALMKSREEAAALAKAMVDIGGEAGKRVCSIITDMRQPLGSYIGNRLEVYEAIQVLSGKSSGDLLTVSMAIAGMMMEMSLGTGTQEARGMLNDALASGKGLEKLREFIRAQGGEESCVDHPETLVEGKQMDVCAGESGYFFRTDTQKLGRAAQVLGAGRLKKIDPIDGSVGIIMRARLSDYLNAGAPIATLLYSDEKKAAFAAALVKEAAELSSQVPKMEPLILETIQ